MRGDHSILWGNCHPEPSDSVDEMFEIHLEIVGTTNFVKCVNKGMRKRRAVQTSEANSLPEILSWSTQYNSQENNI